MKKEEISKIRLDIDEMLFVLADKKVLELFSFSERELEIIRMRWRERMTFEQIAVKLSLGIPTIRGNYHRLFKRLKSRIVRFADNYKAYAPTVEANERLKMENENLRMRVKELESQSPNFKPNVSSLEIKLYDVDCSVRVWNGLRQAGMDTLGDVCKLTKRELLKRRNIGRKTIEEIEEILFSYGLKFNYKQL